MIKGGVADEKRVGKSKQRKALSLSYDNSNNRNNNAKAANNRIDCFAYFIKQNFCAMQMKDNSSNNNNKSIV